MKGWIVGLGLLAATSCASSRQLENEARVHSLRADEAARQRQYDVASREQQEAEWLHRKAAKKAYREGRSDIVVPADVPAPVTPRSPM